MRFKPNTLPGKMHGKRVDNYAKVLDYFLVFYCHAQGLSRTSDMVRKCQIYLHYGYGFIKNKVQKCIPILHKKLQTGLHRLTATDKIESCWSDLLNLLKKCPQYKKFLDDEGNGKVPLVYLRAVELGLRKFASNDKFAMGTFALDSYEEWIHVGKWKKRECYTAVVRYIKGLPGYLKYLAYAWYDYSMRRAVAKTFERRHLQFTNGSKNLKGIAGPDTWSKSPNRRKRKRTAKTKTVTDLTTGSPKAASSSSCKMLFDSEEGEWVSDAGDWVDEA